MTKFYFRYTPARRGLTGAEYIQEFLAEYFPNVTWDAVISDGSNHYGILEGSGDELSKAIAAIEGRFSALKMDEDAFIGVCNLLYNPPEATEGEPEPPTFEEFMQAHGINVSGDLLDETRAFKKTLLKEIARTKFSTWNDSIANIAKSVALLVLHYDSLSSDEKTAVDNLSDTLKSIYSKDVCIDAYQSMVSELQNILQDYYTAKQSVENATSVDDIMGVNLD